MPYFAEIKNMVVHQYQNILENEMNQFIKQTKYEGNRRNGSYVRQLKTMLGTLELTMPRSRKRGFVTSLFDRWKRMTDGISQDIENLFMKGLSYASISLFFRMHGVIMTKQTAANHREKKGFIAIQNITEFPFLFFDGLHFGRKRVLLIALGIKADGTRQILAASLAGKENYEAWNAFITPFASHQPRMVCVDGLVSLGNLVRMCFPGAVIQRCRFHYLQNVIVASPKAMQRQVATEVALALQSATIEEAKNAFGQLQSKYANYSKLVAVLSFNPELFSVLSLPSELRICFRTTNWLERLNRFMREAFSPHIVSSQNESLLFDLISQVKEKYEKIFSVQDERFLSNRIWLQEYLYQPPRPSGEL